VSALLQSSKEHDLTGYFVLNSAAVFGRIQDELPVFLSQHHMKMIPVYEAFPDQRVGLPPVVAEIGTCISIV
jgi:hypothetical protein